MPRNVRDAMAQKNKVDLFWTFSLTVFFWEGGFGFGGKYLALLPATISFWILNSINPKLSKSFVLVRLKSAEIMEYPHLRTCGECHIPTNRSDRERSIKNPSR